MNSFKLTELIVQIVSFYNCCNLDDIMLFIALNVRHYSPNYLSSKLVETTANIPEHPMPPDTCDKDPRKLNQIKPHEV